MSWDEYGYETEGGDSYGDATNSMSGDGGVLGAIGNFGESLYDVAGVYYHGAEALVSTVTGDDVARDQHLAEAQQSEDDAVQNMQEAWDDLGIPRLSSWGTP